METYALTTIQFCVIWYLFQIFQQLETFQSFDILIFRASNDILESTTYS